MRYTSTTYYTSKILLPCTASCSSILHAAVLGSEHRGLTAPIYSEFADSEMASLSGWCQLQAPAASRWESERAHERMSLLQRSVWAILVSPTSTRRALLDPRLFSVCFHRRMQSRPMMRDARVGLHGNEASTMCIKYDNVHDVTYVTHQQRCRWICICVMFNTRSCGSVKYL